MAKIMDLVFRGRDSKRNREIKKNKKALDIVFLFYFKLFVVYILLY